MGSTQICHMYQDCNVLDAALVLKVLVFLACISYRSASGSTETENSELVFVVVNKILCIIDLYGIRLVVAIPNLMFVFRFFS